MKIARLTWFLIGVMGALVHGAETAWDEQFIGPFPNWYDVKRDFGAVGDGKADDTAAIQKALDSVGTPTSKSNALWFPAGTYRITKTLVRTGASGVFFIGEDPKTTIIRWDGPASDKRSRPTGARPTGAACSTRTCFGSTARTAVLNA